MATLRSDIIIDRPVEDVWSVVSDAGAISEWFPSIVTSSVTGDERHCELEGGAPLHEVIVTNDAELHRFQYRIVGGALPAESHLGTIDVIGLDDGRSLVVYGTEIEPDKLARGLGPGVAAGVRGLKEYCESRS